MGLTERQQKNIDSFYTKKATQRRKVSIDSPVIPSSINEQQAVHFSIVTDLSFLSIKWTN